MGNDHRTYIGPAKNWGAVAGHTFKLLFDYGMKPDHKVLDIGCGALRVARMLIPYLNKGRYFGQEPNYWLVKKSMEEEVGQDVLTLKQPTIIKMKKFYDFSFDRPNLKFDYIFAHSIWTHASPALVTKCAIAAAEVMTKKTIFFSSYRDTEVSRKSSIPESDFGEDWLYPGCYAFHRKTMEEAVGKAGLELVDVLSPFAVNDLPQPPRQTWGVFRLKR